MSDTINKSKLIDFLLKRDENIVLSNLRRVVQSGRFDTPNVELLKHIKYRMKMIRADHALSTGYHKRYLTGQYDAYDDVLRRLNREEVTGDEQTGDCQDCSGSSAGVLQERAGAAEQAEMGSPSAEYEVAASKLPEV